MGFRYYVRGWTFGDQLGTGRDEWHEPELYGGQSLIRALWVAFRARRHHGCVKLEMR